jgi:lipopolysaccharide export system permease protein
VIKKIDWYILKKFLTTFAVAILLLTVITIVIDVSEKSDDFIKSGLSLKELIMQYYIGFIPRILTLIFPLFVFISVIFFTSKMAGRTEIVAIIASGTSFRRILRPYFIGAFLLAGLFWVSYRYFIPKANAIYSKFDVKYINKLSSNNTYGTGSTYYFRIDTFSYGQLSYYDTASKRGSNFVLQKIKNNQLIYNLRSENIEWDTATRKWKLTSVVERKIDTMKEEITQYAQMFMALNIKPNEIKKDEYTKDRLTTPELIRFIEREKIKGTEGINDLIVERHKRDATPASIFILTLIAVSVSSRKIRGGSGMHMAVGFIVASLFVLTDRFSTIFATKGSFPPILAAWMPNLVFIIVAIWLYTKAPK